MNDCKISSQVFKGTYDVSYGSPFDRGSADSYYHRSKAPHYVVDGKQVDKESMTEDQITDYYTGYEFNEMSGDKKEL